MSGALNVALHRHLGPVTILLNLTPTTENIVSGGSLTEDKQAKSRRTSLEAKQDDMESIYGLYSDLMKVSGDYVSNVRSPTPNVTAARLAWDLAHMGVLEESAGSQSDAASGGSAIYQETRARHPVVTAATQAQALVAAAAAQQQQVQQQQKQLRRLGSPTESQSPPSQAVSDHLTGAEQGASQPAAYSGNDLYEATARASSEASSKGDSLRQVDPRIRAMAARGEPIYGSGGSPESPGSSVQKTALLLTGGNGYKRGMVENPYSSQHAHCIIWEYKL